MRRERQDNRKERENVKEGEDERDKWEGQI